MRRKSQPKSGIQTLLEKYRAAFRMRENLDYYSSQDYRRAERKFLKYVLEQRRIELDKELYET